MIKDNIFISRCTWWSITCAVPQWFKFIRGILIFFVYHCFLCCLFDWACAATFSLAEYAIWLSVTVSYRIYKWNIWIHLCVVSISHAKTTKRERHTGTTNMQVLSTNRDYSHIPILHTHIYKSHIQTLQTKTDNSRTHRESKNRIYTKTQTLQIRW